MCVYLCICVPLCLIYDGTGTRRLRRCCSNYGPAYLLTVHTALMPSALTSLHPPPPSHTHTPPPLHLPTPPLHPPPHPNPHTRTRAGVSFLSRTETICSCELVSVQAALLSRRQVKFKSHFCFVQSKIAVRHALTSDPGFLGKPGEF